MTQPFEWLVFERSREGKVGCTLPALDVPEINPAETLGSDSIRAELEHFPQISEVEVARHFTRLSQWNFGVNEGMYPLGSCTMKYNPSINETVAAMPAFRNIHPLTKPENCQGLLRLITDIEGVLAEITGHHACSMQPAAGAHGEFTGLLLIRKALDKKGMKGRNTILVPDSAHGTNPATATLAGFNVKEVASNQDGRIDLDALREAVDEQTAGMMITNPNTLGIFESNIHVIADILHENGAYLYMDGANMNALVGKSKPAEMGVDVLHINLHKTFSTPHGGGGPGAGPVCVSEELSAFLPNPRARKTEQGYVWDENPDAVGKVHGWQGHFGIAVRGLCWILTLGAKGLRTHTENAVLNNRYIRKGLEPHYYLPYKTETLHETVFSDKWMEEYGVTALDVAKKLLDFGFHPPTMYFPLVVHGALMIEPTETESRGEMDRFVQAMTKIAELAKSDAQQVTSAPQNTLIRRVDETLAARKPILRWTPEA